jgi:sugar-specific transcriptional regulator TrmB
MNETYLSNIETPADSLAEQVRSKMERRALRTTKTVEHRAARAARELLAREEEYLWLIEDRIDQMKERYWVDRGVDQRVTAAQNSANVIKKAILAASSKARNEIEERVRLFKDGVAILRIEVDAEILNREAACVFVDKIQEHARMTVRRIDTDLSDADTAMRNQVDNLEYGY